MPPAWGQGWPSLSSPRAGTGTGTEVGARREMKMTPKTDGFQHLPSARLSLPSQETGACATPTWVAGAAFC